MMGKYDGLRKKDNTIGVNVKAGNENLKHFPPCCIVEADYFMSSVIVEALGRDSVGFRAHRGAEALIFTFRISFSFYHWIHL